MRSMLAYRNGGSSSSGNCSPALNCWSQPDQQVIGLDGSLWHQTCHSACVCRARSVCIHSSAADCDSDIAGRARLRAFVARFVSAITHSLARRVVDHWRGREEEFVACLCCASRIFDTSWRSAQPSQSAGLQLHFATTYILVNHNTHQHSRSTCTAPNMAQV